VYSGKYTLEIVNINAFDRGDFSKCRPINKSFLEEEKFTDFAIIADDGSRIPCHKVFLAGQCFWCEIFSFYLI